jgi:VWFA-related protein
MLSLLLLSSLLAGVQAQQDPEDEPGGFRIGVAVDQVFLSVNARAAAGGFVRDLEREHFQIFEDGVEQKIVNFYSEGVPAHVVLLIDISGSTRDAQGEIRRAAQGFAESLGAEDRVSIITFNDAPRLVLDWTSDTPSSMTRST